MGVKVKRLNCELDSGCYVVPLFATARGWCGQVTGNGDVSQAGPMVTREAANVPCTATWRED